MKTEELINASKSWFLDTTLKNPVILIKEMKVRSGDKTQSSIQGKTIIF